MTIKKTKKRKPIHKKLTTKCLVKPLNRLLDNNLDLVGDGSCVILDIEMNDCFFPDDSTEKDSISCATETDVKMAEFEIKRELKEFNYVFVKISQSFGDFFSARYLVIATNDVNLFMSFSERIKEANAWKYSERL